MKKYKFKEVPLDIQFKVSMITRRLVSHLITYRELQWLLEKDILYGFLDDETKAYINSQIRKVEN